MFEERDYKKVESFLKKFAEEEFERADRENLKENRTLLRKVSKTITEDHWHDLAEVLFIIGLHRQAMEIFKKLVKKNPKDKKALNGLGLVYVRTGEIEKGLKYYDSALEVDDKYGVAWFNKGKAYFKLEDLKSAAKCFRKGIRINNRNVSAWNNLGLVLKLLGDVDGAVKCYNTALKHDRNYAYSWNNLGYAHVAKGRYEEARKCFKIALRLKPDYKASEKGLALCDKESKKRS